MKKFLTVLLIVALTFTAAFALSSCGGETYNVTFNLAGGEYKGSSDSVVITTSKVTDGKAPAATKEGYDLLGWYTTSDYSGEATTFPYEPTAKVTFYAKWSLKEGYAAYSFTVNEGASVKTIVSNNGVDASPVTTKTGYTFEGWYLKSDFSGEKVEFPYKADEDTTTVTLYAKWTKNSYTVTFDSKGGTGIDAITALYNDAISEPNIPLKENFAFGGWFTDEALTKSFTFDKMPAQDTLLYAKWIGESEGLSYVLSGDGSYYTLTGIGSNKDTLLYIPKNYNGLPVRTIAAGAFNGVSHITSLYIPSSVTVIERGALGGMRNLVSLTVPFIGRTTSSTLAIDNLFGYIFGGSYYDASTAVYQNYSDNTNDVLTSYIPLTLKNVTVTGENIKLGRAAFRGFKTIVKISFEGSIISKEIAPYAFESMVALTTIKLPSSIKTIKNNAFENCRSLTAITLGENSALNVIEAYAFANCHSLESFILPSGVEAINESVFENCYALKTLTVNASGGIITIGARAFYACNSLESIKISDYIVTIGKEAFAHCYEFGGFTRGSSSAAALILPSALISVGEGAFYFCSSITSATININKFNVLPANIFANCRELATVTFSTSASIKEIGANAFLNCVSLSTVTLKDYVETIGESAFNGCTSLTTFKTEKTSSLKKIGDKAFYGCTALTKVVLPQSLTEMGVDAFVNCTKLANSSRGIYFWSAETDLQTLNWNAKWNVVTHADEANEIEEVKANLYYSYSE